MKKGHFQCPIQITSWELMWKLTNTVSMNLTLSWISCNIYCTVLDTTLRIYALHMIHQFGSDVHHVQIIILFHGDWLSNSVRYNFTELGSTTNRLIKTQIAIQLSGLHCCVASSSIPVTLGSISSAQPRLHPHSDLVSSWYSYCISLLQTLLYEEIVHLQDLV